MAVKRKSRGSRKSRRSSRSGRQPTRLDLLLDRVKPGEHEVTIDADGYTREQVDRIYAAAKARGLHASGTRGWILIRDLRDQAEDRARGFSFPRQQQQHGDTLMTTGTCTCGRKGPLYGGGCLRCIQNARTARRVPPHGDAVTSTIAKRLKKFPAADKAAHALVSEYVHRYMGKGLAAVFPRIGTAWERGIHGWAVRNVDTATTIAHFTTRENAEISVVACDQATRPATPARHGDSLGYTTKRYVAGQVGRRHDGRPNYAVSDTMPALGSDGRASDHDTMPDAQKWADELNTRFLHAQRENTREGRIWMEIPHRRGFYAWLVPPPPPRDVWYD